LYQRLWMHRKLNLFDFYNLLLSASWKEHDLSVHISVITIRQPVAYRTPVLTQPFFGVPILQLLLIYRIYDYDMLTRISSTPPKWELAYLFSEKEKSFSHKLTHYFIQGVRYMCDSRYTLVGSTFMTSSALNVRKPPIHLR
jgi:hypothetical protein